MRRSLSALAAAVLSVAVSSYGATTAPVPTLTITRHPERRLPPPDPKAMEAATIEVSTSLTEFRRVANQARQNFEASSEFSVALSAMIDSRNRLDQARMKILTDLKQQPEYLQQLISIEKLDRQLHLARQERNATAVSQLAMQLLQRRAMLSRLERDSLDDPSIADLRQAWVDSANLVASLRENFIQELRRNPDWQQARVKYFDAVRRRAGGR
jgi:hypothetical protein